MPSNVTDVLRSPSSCNDIAACVMFGRQSIWRPTLNTKKSVIKIIVSVSVANSKQQTLRSDSATLVKIFPSFCGSWRLIAVYTRCCLSPVRSALYPQSNEHCPNTRTTHVVPVHSMKTRDSGGTAPVILKFGPRWSEWFLRKTRFILTLTVSDLSPRWTSKWICDNGDNDQKCS